MMLQWLLNIIFREYNSYMLQLMVNLHLVRRKYKVYLYNEYLYLQNKFEYVDLQGRWNKMLQYNLRLASSCPSEVALNNDNRNLQNRQNLHYKYLWLNYLRYQFQLQDLFVKKSVLQKMRKIVLKMILPYSFIFTDDSFIIIWLP